MPIKIKNLPLNMSILIKMLYSTKCQELNILNHTEHLKEAHGLEIKVIKLMVDFQQKERRSRIRSQINSYIKSIEQLRTQKGRMRGRRRANNS